MTPAPTDPPALVRLARHWRVLLEVTATFLAMAVCVELLISFRQAAGAAAPPVRAAAVRPPAPKPPAEPVSLAGAAVLGAKTATVGVLEFSDFQCPYCGAFARDTEPALRKEYVETGKAVLAFRHLPLEQIHPFALGAAKAAACADGQGKFWPVHDALFEHQTGLEAASVRGLAKAAGLDLRRFDACLPGDGAARVGQDVAAARALGVTGTPTFFVGTMQPGGYLKVVSRVSGAVPMDQLRKLLDHVIAGIAPGTK